MNVNEVNKIKWSEDYSFLFFFFFSIATQKGNFSSSEDGKRSIYSFRALRPFDVASSFLEFWKTGTRLRHSIFPPPLLLLLASSFFRFAHAIISSSQCFHFYFFFFTVLFWHPSSFLHFFLLSQAFDRILSSVSIIFLFLIKFGIDKFIIYIDIYM